MQEILIINSLNMSAENAFTPLKNKLKEGYKVINSVNIKQYETVYILELINKPVETTNEQPEKYNLEEWFGNQIEEIKDKNGYNHKHYTPLKMTLNTEKAEMLFCGMELILLSDGTYILNDTTGG